MKKIGKKREIIAENNPYLFIPFFTDSATKGGGDKVSYFQIYD